MDVNIPRNDSARWILRPLLPRLHPILAVVTITGVILERCLMKPALIRNGNVSRRQHFSLVCDQPPILDLCSIHGVATATQEQARTSYNGAIPDFIDLQVPTSCRTSLCQSDLHRVRSSEHPRSFFAASNQRSTQFQCPGVARLHG